MESGMRIMNEVLVSSYIRESYQQLRGQSLLVIGYYTYITYYIDTMKKNTETLIDASKEVFLRRSKHREN
jgi:hypothetical protein